MQTETILETHHLIKEFKGFVAVNGVSLKVKKGHIHALIGPNGAGKTTCFNLLTKVLTPNSGRIVFNGLDITQESSPQIARKGIIRSFQISAIFPKLSVLENVRIALQRSAGMSYHFWKPQSSLYHLHERAFELLEQVDLLAFAQTIGAELPYGRKRALEIATTLAMDPQLMLLDEKVSAHRTILMVEHNMKVVASIADCISVLQRGQIIAEGSYTDVSQNPLVLDAYMGRADAQLEGAAHA